MMSLYMWWGLGRSNNGGSNARVLPLITLNPRLSLFKPLERLSVVPAILNIDQIGCA